MNNYLYNKYKGIYRVLADYDQDTNDFPRDDQGNIDSSFEDFYIPGKKGVQIRHAGQSMLGCYAFGTGMGNNLLKAIYKKELKKEPPSKMETVEKKLIEANIIAEVTHYDGELLFTFKADHLSDWANIFKLKTSGANISPLSSKNLPKSDYEINKADENKYKILFPNGMEPMQKAQVARMAVANIKNKFTKAQNAEMKKLSMKPRQYIHYIGKWDEFLKEVERSIKLVLGD